MTSQRISDGLRRLRDWYRTIRPDWIKSRAALNQDGMALAEFTAILPFFFIRVFGTMEWASIYWLENSMVNAAREGARAYAVQAATLDGANAAACGWMDGSGQQFTVTTTDLCTGLNSLPPNVQVDISVQGDKASIFNWLGMFTGVTFSSSATMRKEIACSAIPAGFKRCTCNTSISPPTCNP
jgi:Flp pilus assembly protein TadG